MRQSVYIVFGIVSLVAAQSSSSSPATPASGRPVSTNSSPSSSAPVPVPSSTSTAQATHNVTYTDTSASLVYGTGDLCNATSCPTVYGSDPWFATWGQDAATGAYFTYHATNQALARKSGGIPYVSFGFQGSAIHLYTITSRSSRPVFNVTIDGGGTWQTVRPNQTTQELVSKHLTWSATGLEPAQQYTLILRFWADVDGPRSLNGADLSGASLNIQEFVVVKPGPDPNLTISASSTNAASSPIPSPSTNTLNDQSIQKSFYDASNRTALILGLSIGIPLFLISLVLCLFLVLCVRRRRRRMHSQLSEGEKSNWRYGMQSQLSSIIADMYPSRRYRGGESSYVARGGGGARRTRKNSQQAGMLRPSGSSTHIPGVGHHDANDTSQSEYGGRPSFGNLPPSPNRPVREAGPLLVPRESISPGPAAGFGSAVEPMPFVLGLSGETKREERQRKRAEGRKPPSVESNMGGSSGEQAGDETEHSTPGHGIGASGSGKRLSNTPTTRGVVAAGLGTAALSDDPFKKDSPPNRNSLGVPPQRPPRNPERSPRSSAHRPLSLEAQSTGSTSHQRKPSFPPFLNTVDFGPPLPTQRSTSTTPLPSTSRSDRHGPSLQIPITPMIVQPSKRTSNSTPSSSRVRKTSGSGKPRTRTPPDQQQGRRSSKSTPELGTTPSGGMFLDKPFSESAKHSPIASTPEPMPRSPLEYFNRNKGNTVSIPGQWEPTTVGAGPSSGNGRAQVSLGIGLVSPAPTVEDKDQETSETSSPLARPRRKAPAS